LFIELCEVNNLKSMYRDGFYGLF